MRGRGTRILWAVALEGVPAVLFGAAAGFCASKLTGVAPLSVTPLEAGAAAFGIAWLALRLFCGNEPQFQMPIFNPADYEPGAIGGQLLLAAPVSAEAELVLDEPISAEEDEELLLEVRAWPQFDDPRVVRLFDPARMPTAGELKERIDRHLHSPDRVIPDAAQELHEAIAALRQSLR
jgi:hypothetical protein